MEQQSRLPAPTVAAHVFMALQQAEIARAGGSQSSESQSTAELKLNSASCRVVDRLPAGSSLPAPGGPEALAAMQDPPMHANANTIVYSWHGARTRNHTACI